MDAVTELDWATFGVALGSLIVLFVVLMLQFKVFREGRQANIFSTLAAVHETLAADDRIALRGYIHTDFRSHLNSAVRDVLGDQYMVDQGEERVDVSKVLAGLTCDHAKHHQITRSLSAQTTGLLMLGAMDAVDRALNDFDLLAIPVSLAVEHAKALAVAYRDPIESTAIEILPYVAIQRQLRGTPSYRAHYISLLQELNIPTMGL